MDVTNLISNGPMRLNSNGVNGSMAPINQEFEPAPEQHNMRPISPQKHTDIQNSYSTPTDFPLAGGGGTVVPANEPTSPSSPIPKNVAFELLLDDESKMKARIPMRVQIFPHDTTDSIVTTVKNFYGIYDGAGSGVSFEDENGTTLIARYENLRDDMTVYVRVIPNYGYSSHPYFGESQNVARPCLGEPFRPTSDRDRPSRSASQVSRKRSCSPPGRGRRSASTQKPTRSNNKSRCSSTNGSFIDDGLVPYSDSDGGHASITSSKKGRGEHFASSEISMENILHDGRRKRPKFDSSELPLFVPPQVPRTASASSISPQRRSIVQDGASPFARPAHPFGPNAFHSPQNIRGHEQLYSLQGLSPFATPGVPAHNHQLRERANSNSVGVNGNRLNNCGILPTPDPTIASCISDEDVAMQLIRLGDASNFSHGRTSLSTADDAFSGIADASSSTGVTSDGEMSPEEDGPHKPAYSDFNGNPPVQSVEQEYRTHTPLQLAFENVPAYDSQAPKFKRAKSKATNSSMVKTKQTSISRSAKVTKARSGAAPRKTKIVAMNDDVSNKFAPHPPSSPGAGQMARKPSGSGLNFQHQLAADEEDLSTKPRCQRCRKSKKGCDRQRPCQRCRDAGIGIEGCISEDEGNGRKGRYGRHMGVPIKKTMNSLPDHSGPQNAVPPPIANTAVPGANKKRKR